MSKAADRSNNIKSADAALVDNPDRVIKNADDGCLHRVKWAIEYRRIETAGVDGYCLCVEIRVALDLIFLNPAGAGFGIADPAGAGAGAECS